LANPTFLFPVGNVKQSRGFIPGTHYGIDFSVPVGTPVHAAGDGTITYENNEPGGYGNIITISHANNFQTRYGHLSQFLKPQGTVVKAGDVIGLSGGAAGAEGSGNSTGPHLHFEIRTDPNTPVDPMPYLSGTSTVGADTSSGSTSDTSGGSGGLAGAIGFFTALTSGSTWIRIGEVLGALVLFYVAYKLYNDELNFSM
jgi:hypothetical protein